MSRSVAALIMLTSAAVSGAAQNDSVVRLEPSAFADLPRGVIAHLEGRGCRIPQSFSSDKPHNVVRGRFEKPGREDWAVLCSVKGISSILIFRADSVVPSAELAPERDEIFLQDTGSGRMEYSRAIGVAGPQRIAEILRQESVEFRAGSLYDAVEDAFLEKASTINYYHDKRWLQLQGAD